MDMNVLLVVYLGITLDSYTGAQTPNPRFTPSQDEIDSLIEDSTNYGLIAPYLGDVGTQAPDPDVTVSQDQIDHMLEDSTKYGLIAPYPGGDNTTVNNTYFDMSDDLNLNNTLVTADITAPTTTLNPHACYDNVQPCLNNGTCNSNSHTCICTSDFEGSHCDRPTTCPLDHCHANNTDNCSVDKDVIGYKFTCNCKLYFIGNFCEMYDHCHSNPCLHGGACINDAGEVNYTCNCEVGDPNNNCRLNDKDECIDSGHVPSSTEYYITCIDRIGVSELICRPGYTGAGCRDTEDPQNYCLRHNCSDEGYCKVACNVPECNGTSNCNFTAQAFQTDGFENSTGCKRDFADGFVYAACEKEETLFDGFDHVFHDKTPVNDCSPFFNTVCTKAFNNGYCDKLCNTSACLWDGFDCLPLPKFPPEVPGGVVVEFQHARPIIDVILKKLMMMTRSLLKVKTTGAFNQHDPQVTMVAMSSNFTRVKYLGKFIAGAISKLPGLVDNVQDVFYCEPGTYDVSNKCSTPCGKCLHDEPCDWRTGECLHACADGYHSRKCDQICNPACNGTCDTITGHCPYCPDGRYGAMCERSCDIKCNNNVCNVYNGSCECLEGRVFREGHCACKHGFYGNLCEKECVNCYNRDCHELTGVCSRTCISGFYGDKCETRCQEQCDTCDRKTGECQTKKQVQPQAKDNTGLIIGLITGFVLIALIVIVACWCWRERQSGDYVMKDEEDGYITQKAPDDVAAYDDNSVHVAAMGLLASPNIGRSQDMVDMDTKTGSVVYAGPERTPLLNGKKEDAIKEKADDSEHRQPADGDSEAEQAETTPTGNGVNTGRKFSSSVTIAVDEKGRLSISEGQQVPSPTLKEEDVFDDHNNADSPPEVAAADNTLPSDNTVSPQSSVGESRAPLASEEDLLSGLGAKSLVTETKVADDVTEHVPDNAADDNTEEQRSRKSSSSSKHSSSSSGSNYKQSDREAEPTTEM